MKNPELLRQIATAMEQDPEGWWRGFEFYDTNTESWMPCRAEGDVWMPLLDGFEIRPRPRTRTRTITINVEVPEPMREMPEFGKRYFRPGWGVGEGGVLGFHWSGSITDLLSFDRGIWPTEAQAQQAADAIFGALGGKHD